MHHFLRKSPVFNMTLPLTVLVRFRQTIFKNRLFITPVTKQTFANAERGLKKLLALFFYCFPINLTHIFTIVS